MFFDRSMYVSHVAITVSSTDSASGLLWEMYDQDRAQREKTVLTQADSIHHRSHPYYRHPKDLRIFC